MTTAATLDTSYVKVYVWPGDASVRRDGTGGEFGHAALEIFAENTLNPPRNYISLWPGSSFSFEKFKWINCKCGEKNSHTHNSLEVDRKFCGETEAQIKDYLEPTNADSIIIRGLDIAEINRVWNEYKAKGLRWSLLSGIYSREQNCSGLVLHLLEVGGLREIVPERIEASRFVVAVLSSWLALRGSRLALQIFSSKIKGGLGRRLTAADFGDPPWKEEEGIKSRSLWTLGSGFFDALFLDVYISKRKLKEMVSWTLLPVGVASAVMSNYAFVKLVTPGQVKDISEKAAKKERPEKIRRIAPWKESYFENTTKIALSILAVSISIGFEKALIRCLPLWVNEVIDCVGGTFLFVRVIYPRVFNFIDTGFVRKRFPIRVTQSSQKGNQTRSVAIEILTKCIIKEVVERLIANITRGVINSGNENYISGVVTLVSMDYCRSVFKYTNVIFKAISNISCIERFNDNSSPQVKIIQRKEGASARVKQIADFMMLCIAGIVVRKCAVRYPVQINRALMFLSTSVICTAISRNETEASDKSHPTQIKAVRKKESGPSRMKYIANCIMLFATSIVCYKYVKRYPTQTNHVFSVLDFLRSIEPIAPIVYQKLRSFADKKIHDTASQRSH